MARNGRNESCVRVFFKEASQYDNWQLDCCFSLNPHDRYSEGPPPGDIWIEPEILEQGDGEKVKLLVERFFRNCLYNSRM